MSVAVQRLKKEFVALRNKPLEKIRAMPCETDILEWHYVLEGPAGSPFDGGHYHGTVTFPKEYPFKPPSIMMLTPNGRFETGTRLCLSMSDFHPESWNPLWSVGTILMGLYSFMLEDQATTGSVTTSAAAKRRYAQQSLAHNVKNKKFAELFPDLIELHESRIQAEEAKAAAVAAAAAAAAAALTSSSSSSSSSSLAHPQASILNGAVAVGAGNAAVGAGDAGGLHVTTLLGVLAAVLATAYMLLSISVREKGFQVWEMVWYGKS